MEFENTLGLLGSWPKQFVEDDLGNFKNVLLEDGGTIGLGGEQEYANDFKIQPPLDQTPRQEEDDFEAWMDEKMDLEKLGLSLMDFEVPGGILDDLLAMDGLPSELGSSLVDPGPAKPEGLNLPPLDTIPVSKVSVVINNEPYGSPGCTPPDSPSALVPEIPSPKPFVGTEQDQSLNNDIANLVQGFPWASCTSNDLLIPDNSENLVVSDSLDVNVEEIGYVNVMPPQNETSSNVIILLGAASSPTTEQKDEISFETSYAVQMDSDSSDAPNSPSRKRRKGKQASGKSGRRPVSEATRRERKKNQNKDAATRYRYKKRAELQLLLDEETALQGKNSELKENVQKLSNEISYLKNLMREVFKAKGLLK